MPSVLRIFDRMTPHQSIWIVIALATVLGQAPPGGAASGPALSREGASPASAADQEPSLLRFDEAVRIGLDQHPLLERSRHSTKAAQAVTKQVRGEQYPWLEASVAGTSGSLRVVSADGKFIHDRGGHGFDPGGALPKHNQNMLTGGLLVNQLITDFGYTAHRIVANEVAEAATEQQLQTHRALVILGVQKAYVNGLMQQELVTIAQETLKRRRALAEVVRSLYTNQLKSKVDLDFVLVEVADAELALIRTSNDLTRAFAALSNAMGGSEPRRYRLDRGALSVTPPANLPALIDEGLKARPELLGAHQRVEASLELVRAAKALNFGSITAIGMIGVTKYFQAHDSGITNNEVDPIWGVGATAHLPLFTGFRIRNQIEEAEHRKGETDQELRNLANDVALQVIRAYLSQTTNAEQVSLDRERVSFAREALTLAQERYRLGLNPILEVIRANTALFEAEARLAEAEAILRLSAAALAYATGSEYKRYE